MGNKSGKSDSPPATTKKIVLKKRYIIESKIGRGAVGNVYKARDRSKNEVVAIKQLASNTEIERQRFMREYTILTKIDHPNLVSAHDYFEERGKHYIVMEYVDGDTLGELLVRRDQPVSLPEQIAVANKLSRALEVLHTVGVIHRDIKPENLIINTKTGDVKILDLGVGKDTADEESQLTQKGAVVGTLGYMSPEQIENKISPQSDIFSLGVCLYQFFLWDSTPPFQGTSNFEIMVKVAEEDLEPLFKKIRAKVKSTGSHLEPEEERAYQDLSQTITKCIAKKPEKRWESSQKLADHLADIHQAFISIQKYNQKIRNQKMASLSKQLDNDTKQRLAKLKQALNKSQAKKRITQKKLIAHKSNTQQNKQQKLQNTLNKAIIVGTILLIILLTIIFSQ